MRSSIFLSVFAASLASCQVSTTSTDTATTTSSVGTLSTSMTAGNLSMTMTTSTTSASASASATGFVLQAIPIANSAVVRKRQAATPQYISPSGLVTNDCTAGVQVNVVGGELFAVGGGQFSTSTGTAFAPFVASTIVGDITVTFTAGGSLQWANAAFTLNAGVAGFCTLASGELIATFTASPAGCSPVLLAPSFCPVANAGATGPNSITTGNINNSTVINLINNGVIQIGGYNTNINVLPGAVLAEFASNSINFYSADSIYYYAKMCPVCDVVQVFKANNTFATQSCSTCPLVIQQCPVVTILTCTNATTPLPGSPVPPVAGQVQYAAPTCLSCPASSSAPVVSYATTIPVVASTPAVCVNCPASTSAPTAPAIVVSSGDKLSVSLLGSAILGYSLYFCFAL